MAISLVGSNQAAATSVAIPSHVPGDLILISAYRANNTAASLGSGYTNIRNAGANTVSIRSGFLIATGTSHTSGTWTNATQIVVSVWRSNAGKLSIGGHNEAGASAASITYPAATAHSLGGRSVAYRVGARNTALAAVATPPTDYTLITSTPATPAIASFYRAGIVAHPAQQTVSMGASNGVRAHTIEIVETLGGPHTVRQFNTSQFVQFSIGTGGMATVLQGAFTVAAVCRRHEVADTLLALLSIETGGGSRGQFGTPDDDTQLMRYLRGQFESPGTGPLWAHRDWVLVAFGRSAGTSAVRYHIGVLENDAWMHQDSSGTVGNDDNTATLMATRYNADNSWVGRLRYAMMAVWNSNLGDSAIEDLKTGTQAWIDSSPIWHTRYDQPSTSNAINDLTGNGGNQSSLTGSSVVIGEWIPGWQFDPPGRVRVVSQAFGANNLVVSTAGVAATEQLLCIVDSDTGGSGAFDEDDWELLGTVANDADRAWLFRKLDPGPGEDGYTFTIGSGADGAAILLAVEEGYDVEDYDLVASQVATNLVAPSVDASVDDSILLSCWMRWGNHSGNPLANPITPPGGMDPVYSNVPSGSFGWRSCSIEDVDSGGTGTRTATHDATTRNTIVISVLLSTGAGGETHNGGSESTVQVLAEGAPANVSFSGGSEAGIGGVAAEGSGTPSFVSGSEAIVLVIPEGSPELGGGSEAIVLVEPEGAGNPTFTGGSEATVGVVAQGGGFADVRLDITVTVGPSRASTAQVLASRTGTVAVASSRTGTATVGTSRTGTIAVGPTRESRGK